MSLFLKPRDAEALADILDYCYDMIKQGDTQGITDLIQMYPCETATDYQMQDYAQEWVASILQGYQSLSDWLALNKSYLSLKMARLAILDLMLTELENEFPYLLDVVHA